MVRQLNRPVSGINKFSGDPVEYQQFKRQFRTRALNNSDSFDEKMTFLKQFNAGESNSIVSMYSPLESENGFKAVFSQLDKQHGDIDIIVNAFITKSRLSAAKPPRQQIDYLEKTQRRHYCNNLFITASLRTAPKMVL